MTPTQLDALMEIIDAKIKLNDIASMESVDVSTVIDETVYINNLVRDLRLSLWK